MTSTRCSRVQAGHSRGHSAAASLKRRSRAERHPRWRQFPRPFGRGLIEAFADISGAVAAAQFPRPFGRGLIEAAALRDGADASFSFPRPFGRGLIEAMRKSAKEKVAKLIPAAIRPRPH